MSYGMNRQKILSRSDKYGASVGGIRVDREWFESLWPDENELSHLDKQIGGTVLHYAKRSAKQCKGDCPVGCKFSALLMLVAIRDGLPEVAKQLMDARTEDLQIGFEIAYKDGLAKFRLLQIVE